MNIDYSKKEGRNSQMAPRVSARKFKDRMNDLSRLIWDGAKILEVGCAEGGLAQIIKEKFAVEYQGVEPSKDANTARSVLDKVYENIESIESSIVYNFILSFHTLEHIPDIQRELELWKRKLDPEGTVILEVPNGAGHPDIEVDRNVEHLHFFSPATLLCALENAGFSIIKLSIGHYESPCYPDSIRVLARHRDTLGERISRLLRRYSEVPMPIAVYGLGGDFKTYIEPYLSMLNVCTFLDRSPTEKIIDGIVVQCETYSRSKHYLCNIIVCSIRHEVSISNDLAEFGHPEERMFFLSNILEAGKSETVEKLS